MHRIYGLFIALQCNEINSARYKQSEQIIVKVNYLYFYYKI